jgi:hypothetical protein
MTCEQCGAPLDGDDIGIYKKLINRGATTFCCRPCLAERLHCSTELLDEKIRRFRAEGCTLFAPPVEPTPIRTDYNN